MHRAEDDVRVNAGRLAILSVTCLLVAARPGIAAGDLRLVEAIKNRDTQAVQRLLGQKVDVRTTEPDGGTALHWAVHLGDRETAVLLIRAGALVNAANDNGVTPLSLACTNGSAAIVDLLLNAGANPNTTSPVTGETVLMTAARTGVVDVVRMLVDRGADVNATEPQLGQTALMWAAAEGHSGIVRVLVERGAGVRTQSKAGFTPLLFAARTGNVEIIRFLLDAGAGVNEEARDGTTALLVAIVRSHMSLARFLLTRGADSNKGPGFTPLHWAAGNWSDTDTIGDPGARSDNNEWSALEGFRGAAKRELVKLLLDHGANPNARAQGNPPRYGAGRARGGILAGATPFFVAARAGDVEVMRLLVAAGADPLLPNNQKITPLMVASGVGVRGHSPVPEREALEAMRLSVELGNDINAVDAAGETALHGTAYRGISGSSTLIRFLVDKGAKLNVKNTYGWTPLAIAEGIYYGGSDTRSDPTAAFLRTLGAEPTSSDVERNGNIALLKAGRIKEPLR
jgi:ankyrin repeat protein